MVRVSMNSANAAKFDLGIWASMTSGCERVKFERVFFPLPTG